MFAVRTESGPFTDYKGSVSIKLSMPKAGLERFQANCPQCQAGEAARIWDLRRGTLGDKGKSTQKRKGTRSDRQAEGGECPGGLCCSEDGGGS